MFKGRIKNFEIWHDNREEYHLIKSEIFGQDIYYAELRSDPVIVDVGAHIGLSVLYFKSLYPKASILAIEPNPFNIALLKLNIEANRLNGISLAEMAVGKDAGSVNLNIDDSGDKWYSTGSLFSGAWNQKQTTRRILVKERRLGEFLPKRVDLLKLDVEGAEEDVLLSLRGEDLAKIELIIFEYHPIHHKTPDKIIKHLYRNGFETTFFQKGKQMKTFKAVGMMIGRAVKE